MKRIGLLLPYVDNLRLEGVVAHSFGSSDNEAVYGTYGNNSIGISLVECSNFEIDGCTASDCAHYGIQLWICARGTVSKCKAPNNGGHGFGGAAIKSVTFDNNDVVVDSDSLYSYELSSGHAQGYWFRQVSDVEINGGLVYRDPSITVNEGAAVQFGNQSGLATAPKTTRMAKLIPNPSALINDGSRIAVRHIEGSWQKGVYVWGGNNELTYIAKPTIFEIAYEAIAVTSGRAIIDEPYIKGGCANYAIWVNGRDSLVSRPYIKDVDATAIYMQGVRHKVHDFKIEGFALVSAGYAVTFSAYSNNPEVIGGQVYSSDISNADGGIYIPENINASVVVDNYIDPAITDGLAGPIDNSSFKAGHRWANNVADMTYVQTTGDGHRWKVPGDFGGDTIWKDGSGKIRTKSGSPGSDADGVIIGTQAA